MGNFRYAINMLKKDVSHCVFYVLSMCCSISVLLNMFNILFNEEFTNRADSSYMTYSSIAVILLIAAIIFMVFANLYFIYSKTKEFAIIVLSGRSVHELGYIILIQNVILGIIGVTLGIIIGICLIPITNIVVYNAIGLVPQVWYISKLGIFILVSIMIMQFIVMIMVDMGYVYRREVAELVRETNQGYSVDNRSFKFNPNVYFIGYILPILIPILMPTDIVTKAGLSIMLIIPSIIPISGLIKHFIPKAILKLKEKVYAYDKIKLIALSNLHYSIRKAGLLIVTLVVCIFIIAFLVVTNVAYPHIEIITLIAYFVTIVLLAITIVYKMLIEVISRKNVFKQTLLLGFTKKQISKIIRAEVLYFFGIIIIVPMLSFGVFFTLLVMSASMPANYAIIMLVLYIGTYVIAGLIAYIAYNNIIKKYMKSF